MRTGPIVSRFLMSLCIVLSAQTAMALDMGLVVSTGNLQLPWTPATPITDSTFPSSNYIVGGEAWLASPLGEDAAIRISYERDPILRNSAIAGVQFERGIASISVGPQFGFLNSTDAPFSLGLSSSVRLQWPGVAYISMRSDGGMAISIIQAVSDPQARTEFAAGFYVPNAIVSGLISAKRFSELDTGGGLVTDSLTRYAMTIDIYKKNVPYTALLSVGYDLRSKHFTGASATDSLGAIMLGLDATAQIDQAFKLKGSFSTGAYVFGLDDLKNKSPSNSAFLFSASLGVAVDTAAIKVHPKKGKEETEATLDSTPASVEREVQNGAESASQPPAAKKSALSIEAGGGLYYELLPLSGATLDLSQAASSLRGGLLGDLMFPLGGAWKLGGELGLFFGLDAGFSSSLLELPLNAKLAWSSGKLELDALVGLFGGASLLASGQSFGLGVDAGARIKYLGIYAEASYILGLASLQSFPRFGIGYLFPIVGK